MTNAAWVWLAAAAVFAVSDWVAVAEKWPKPNVEYLAKPATMVALIGVALAVDPAVPERRWWFVAALALSMVGDILLMLRKDLFVAGLASFLLAHLAYIGGLTRHGGSAGAFAASAAPVVVVTGLVGIKILRAARGAGTQAPLALYMAAIGAMVTTALATGKPLLGLGASLFLVSDSLIAWNRFVKPLKWAPLVIIVTYHLAQTGLVTGMST